MADFLGMSVKLVLKDSAHTIICGEVDEVIAGQTLKLLNATFLSTGARYAKYTVPGWQIADLEVIARNVQPKPSPGQILHRDQSKRMPPQQNAQTSGIDTAKAGSPSPPQKLSTFVDPAIVSFGKASTSTVHNQLPSKLAVPRTQQFISIVPRNSRTPPVTATTMSKAQQTSPVVDDGLKSIRAKGSPKVEIMSLRHDTPHQNQGVVDRELDIEQQNTSIKKKLRRAQRKKAGTDVLRDPPPVMNANVSRNGNDMEGTVARGTGWRQTPLLKPLPQPSALCEKPHTKKRPQRARDQDNQQNGWATEDATDIQEMGEFDFEANHRLFNKHEVFSRIREADTTADEDRLFSHNKVHRPGTHGGKNLHPTESVLSPKLGPKHNNHELDSASDADTELNGRSSSRHSVSRAAITKQPSRQGSTHVDSKTNAQLVFNLADRGLGLSYSTTSLSGRGGKDGSSMATPSPRPEAAYSPQLPSVTHRLNHASLAEKRAQEPHLAIASTLLPCPVLFPTALETLENETSSRFGLSPDAMTESSARCIAESAIAMIENFSKSRLGLHKNGAEGEQCPLVVMLTGSHPTGARAVAAIRHLICRRVKVILAEAYPDAPANRDAQTDLQTTMVKRLARSGASIQRGSWQKASQYIKNLSGPPSLIIDALLAGASYAPNALQAPTFRDMIEWANRSRAPVLSLACPSGISGTDGVAPVVDGEPLAVRADVVLGLGAPLRGLLLAMRSGERWREVLLADIGINITLRADENVPFGGSWIVQLKLLDGDSPTSVDG